MHFWPSHTQPIHQESPSVSSNMVATEADYKRLGAWAVMLNPDLNIDRHTCQRTVPMEVLSLAPPRTGTLSMNEALGILGYPACHYSSIFANVKDADMWNEAMDYKYKGKGHFEWKQGFDKLLGQCSAVTDVPAICFWKELIEAYPDAKVLLVERDEEKWLASIGGLIDGVLNPVARYVLRFTDPFWFGRINTCGAGWIECWLGSTHAATAKRNSRAVFRAHNANIRKAVPKERLLVYKLGSGWEPLCKFLGKEVPSTPFPHRNEAETLQAGFGAVLKKAFTNSLINIAVVLGAMTMLLLLARRILG